MKRAEKYAEIINPSDLAYLPCDDREAACLACIVVGRGGYGLTCGEEQVMPLFLFQGIEAVEEWLQGAYPGPSLEDRLNDPAMQHRMAEVLEGVIYDDPEKFWAFADYIDDDKKDEFQRHYNDENRSSLNNIGATCLSYANHFRKSKIGEQFSSPTLAGEAP